MQYIYIYKTDIAETINVEVNCSMKTMKNKTRDPGSLPINY